MIVGFNDPVSFIDPEGNICFVGVAIGAVIGGVSGYFASGGTWEGALMGAVIGGASGFLGQFGNSWYMSAAIGGLVSSGEDMATQLFVEGRSWDCLDKSRVIFAGALAALTAGIGKGLCFVEGTLVETDEGLKPIEDIQIGDKVLSRNEETGELSYREVVQLFVTPDVEILELEFETESGTSETIGTTADHPFWLKNTGWTAATRLLPGDEVYTSTGGWQKVTGSTWLSQRQTVYNFEVAETHNYFVGEGGVWVHNMCGNAEDVAESAADVAKKKTPGFGAGDPPARIEGPWTKNDVYNGLQGRSPKSLNRPQIHHGDQMPGVLHEAPVDIHQKGGLHGQPKQGVTDKMRTSDRNLHWWYRAREQGADSIYPDDIYD